MITRIFRARVPAAHQAEFEEKFLTVSVPFVRSAAGCVSLTVGRPTKWSADEYVMVSVWQSEAVLAAFAGKDWSQPVIPRGMERFIAECWVHHYENFG